LARSYVHFERSEKPLAQTVRRVVALPGAPREPRKRGFRGPWLAVLIIAVTAVAAVALAWSLRPRPVTAPQARQYLNLSACLLTGPSGVVPGTPAAAAWAAMESASLATRVMVDYLPDTGPADVTPMLNTLIQRQCGMIITTGAAASQVIEAAKANPRQQFMLVSAAGSTATGSTAMAAPANTAVVSATAAAARIGQAIRALAAQA
jgi:basic membrane lipoprotein Med (substrate-binding protein (PBP1-ABC) superfamily)